ncbi:hypothetical protein B7P43_G10749 [Cryptotermes secundus]|uniref:Multidrug resistance-associated protein lethal(2)03659 n=1 Tax=Cryptotermes secundus TaxID=105785 RepID=A0A2J7R0Z4_9NEOP|nr:hypothetical protein B7P43_G10749 [Cryptotermes secundus]
MFVIERNYFVAFRLEIQAIRAAAYTRGFLLSFDYFATRFAVFVSIVTYYLLDNKITADRVFVVTAYFNIVKHVMTDFFPRAVLTLAECWVSIMRLQKFLLSDELITASEPCVDSETIATLAHIDRPLTSDDEGMVMNGALDQKTSSAGSNINADVAASKKGIKIANVTARWSEDLPENTLTDVSLDVRPGELVAVVGPVGSGKTSLLHAILKELPLNSGSISVGGSVSYASQEPWLFTGSVRQNILFAQPMDRNRYRQVVRVCALERDFQLLPHGDRTIVGERGVTLSGGQRARISLARTIYKVADIYLLDDPLSAVDTHVGHHLFDDCICDFLQGKTRLVVTHQLQYLQAADNIVILNNGTVEATGTFSRLQESGLDFVKQLDLDIDEEDRELKKGSVDYDKSHGSCEKMIRQNSETSQSSLSGSEPVQSSEMRTQGHVGLNVYRSYFAAGGNCYFILLVCAVCVLVPVATRSGDYWMAYWTNVEELRVKLPGNSHEDVLNVTSAAFLNITTTRDHVINSTIYAADAPFLKNSTMNVPAAVSAGWSWIPSSETCIYVYIGLIVSIIFLIILRVICFFTMCTRASVKLHDSMFSSITHATMAFFSHNPSGRILNRFTNDMGTVDESLPLTLLDCVQIGLSLLAVVIVVSVVNVWLLIPTTFMFIMFYALRQYYLSTSRSLKRLEAITRSPVFSHLSASLQGLTTIRASGAQALLEKEFDSLQDMHSSVWYIYIASNRAFGLWLDVVCSVYIGLVTLSFLIVGGKQYGGDVGLAITQAMMLTGMLQWGVRQSAEMENQMTSVERVLEYTEVEKEPPLESPHDRKPPDSWPSQGVIVFDRIFLAYSKNEASVLKNISFVIRPGEKVGIVGRTGAGKSSLIAALFRLVDVSSGRIQIDGIDIASIGLHDLRSKISIIPQESVLFSGSLRENLDPFSEYSDAALWAALAEVELKQVVGELPAGLSHRVSEGGSNFSVGQRQLLCLARAIIRNNKILVLDEATANVDPQTDELIQETICHKFTDCTVLTIAHRLHTVMDSDRILVMDAGSVVEFDHPHALLKNENGYLYQMVQQTGHPMAESLLKVAHESYGKRMSKKV